MKSRNSLTQDQIHNLAQIIGGRYSPDKLSLELVATECAELIENIAGMESLSETELLELIHHVWSDLSEK